VSATLYLEGGASGADSKDQQIRCRAGFRKLLEKCDYKKRMPRLFACGSRDAAFDDFKIALAGKGEGDYVALWIDSEDPLTDLEVAWEHLKRRDNWMQPTGANDDQVLLMTTCMETLIAADHAALTDYYGDKLQRSALPLLVNLENRGRHDVQDKLVHATRNCANAYAKGKRSFEILAKLTPATSGKYLPSFVRTRRILDQNLVVEIDRSTTQAELRLTPASGPGYCSSKVAETFQNRRQTYPCDAQHPAGSLAEARPADPVRRCCIALRAVRAERFYLR
jgi:hypothetical protein